MMADLDECEPVAQAPTRGQRVYQIRTPGAAEWLELDKPAWDRIQGVRGIDSRVLLVLDETIVG